MAGPVVSTPSGAVSQVQTNRRALILAIMVCFGGFVFGLDAALISGTKAYIIEKLHTDAIGFGYAVSSPALGVVLALLVTGTVCDRLGRRRTLLIIGWLYLLSVLLAVVSQNIAQLVAARFLGGLAFASLSVSSMYVGEIAPPARRGLLVAVNQLNIVVGLFVAYLANYFIQGWVTDGSPIAVSTGMAQYTWQWMLGVQIPPSILWVLFLMRVPESPRWLMLKGRVEEARTVMSGLIGPGEVEQALTEIDQTIRSETTEGEAGTLQKLREMFSPSIRKAAVIGFIIAAIQPATGINAIMFYAPYVVEQAGVGADASFLVPVVNGVFSIIATSLALVFIDRVGRRTILLGGLSVAAASLIACSLAFATATYQLPAERVAELPASIDRAALQPLVGKSFPSDVVLKRELANTLGAEVAQANEAELLKAATSLNIPLVLIGIAAFVTAFQFSIGPIMWVILSEIFPTAVRGVAIPTCALATSLVNYAVQQLFPWQLISFGAASVFGVYAAFVVAGLLVLWKMLPETRGKTIEEVARELSAWRR
ncbi:MFS transporter [Caulobacter sp. X]|uniref:MFS transporter n=1 Tax=Caulobacter sp. X TaxID=2048901 RepID=UPI000C14BAA1|nr:MFS transporter [Caulobacter sp. X]PIB95238.1 MFS transporter [Caulobacter sp. X]